MSRLGAMARRIGIIVFVVGVMTNFVLALRADELEEAETRLEKCTDVSNVVLDAIATKLNAKADRGILRYGHTVQATDLPDGPWLVSAQLRRPGRPRSAPGDILTWITAGKPSAPVADYAAVDLNAIRLSDWPDAADTVNVTLDAAIESRACVHETRPGTKGLFH